MVKIKVAVVLHGLGTNGIDTLFANLSNVWDLERFELTYLLAVDEGIKQFWEDQVVKHGIKVVHLHDLDKHRLTKWPITLYKAFKEHGPFDAVHLNMDMLNGINAMVARRAGIPIRICHAHRSSSENANVVKKIYLAIMKYLTERYATKRVACSDVAGKYFFSGEHEIIYNGIDLQKYRSSEIKERNPMEPVFVTVGRFTELKNPFFLLEVFEQVQKIKPGAVLRWVGSGELYDPVREKARAYGIAEKVEFMGIRDDVSDILKKSDYFLLPSVSEGLSLALAEAQAAQLDCFVSEGISKMSDCGKCIYISLNEPACRWAEIICGFISNGSRMEIDEEKLAKFDIRCTAKELQRLYGGVKLQ